MVRNLSLFACAVIAAVIPLKAAEVFEKDTIRTSAGNVEITFVGHGTLMLRWGGKVIHIDPWSNLPGLRPPRRTCPPTCAR